MNKMNKLEQKIASIILCVVIAGVLGAVLHFAIIKNNNTQIEQMEKQIVDLSKKVDEAKKAPALIISYKAKINELIGGSEENASQLNKTIDVPEVLALIENSSASSGLQLEEISLNGNASFVKGGLIEKEDGTTQDLVNAENFYLLEMKLKTVGDYGNLFNFLKVCENSGYYATVDHIAISDKKSIGARLEGELQINFYSIVESKNASKQE